MSATGGNDGRDKARFDFALVGVDDKERRVFATPDPRRYERVVRDGEQFLLDKYLHDLIPFREIIKDLDKLPMFQSPRTIDSASAYALKRRDAVERELDTGEYRPPEET